MTEIYNHKNNMIDKTVFFLVYFEQHICVILYIYTI